MTLLTYQKALELNTLYELSDLVECIRNVQVKPNLWFKGGTINIYTSQSATLPTALSDMTLGADDTELAEDVHTIEQNTRYIALVQSRGTTNEIVLSGINAVEKGSIS